MVTDNYQKGAQRIAEILGADVSENIASYFGNISADFARYIIELGYGDFYSRQGLDDKHRELIVVTSLIGQGITGPTLRTHLQALLNVGWTRKEVEEILLFQIPFVGFPTIVAAMDTFGELSGT